MIDLGKSEATAGLTVVCLSRAKRLVELLAESILFDRLSKLGNKIYVEPFRLMKEGHTKVLVVTALGRHL